MSVTREKSGHFKRLLSKAFIFMCLEVRPVLTYVLNDNVTNLWS